MWESIKLLKKSFIILFQGLSVITWIFFGLTQNSSCVIYRWCSLLHLAHRSLLVLSATQQMLQYSLWREWAPWNQHRYCGTMYADTIPTNQMQPKRRVVLAVIMSFWLCACCFSEPAWSSTGAGVPVNKLILSCAFQTVTQKWSNRKKKERPNREVTFHVYFISVC